MLLPGEGGARSSVPLSELARFGFSEGLNQVSRENGQRRVVVQANVRGNDLGSFVAEAQEKVDAQVKLPTGSFIEWGGQFENLQAASARLSIVIPIIFAAIFGTLIPLVLNHYKIDPALATGPFVTTLNDIVGLFIYFTVGMLLYHI